MTQPIPFEAILGDWRTKTGLSQSKAAEALGVPLKTLQKWDQGASVPGKWRMDALLKKMAQVEAKIQRKAKR